MRIFTIGVTLYLLDYFKVPVATGDYEFLIAIGFLLAIIQDIVEVLRFFKTNHN